MLYFEKCFICEKIEEKKELGTTKTKKETLRDNEFVYVGIANIFGKHQVITGRKHIKGWERSIRTQCGERGRPGCAPPVSPSSLSVSRS